MQLLTFCSFLTLETLKKYNLIHIAFQFSYHRKAKFFKAYFKVSDLFEDSCKDKIEKKKYKTKKGLFSWENERNWNTFDNISWIIWFLPWRSVTYNTKSWWKSLSKIQHIKSCQNAYLIFYMYEENKSAKMEKIAFKELCFITELAAKTKNELVCN